MYQEAYDNFIQGKGPQNKPPTPEHCTILIEQNQTIRAIIKQSINNRDAAVSIMPYGDSIISCPNPTYIGPYTTTMTVKTADSPEELLVHFDRN